MYDIISLMLVVQCFWRYDKNWHRSGNGILYVLLNLQHVQRLLQLLLLLNKSL